MHMFSSYVIKNCKNLVINYFAPVLPAFSNYLIPHFVILVMHVGNSRLDKSL